MRRLLRWSVVLLLLWGGWRLLPRLLEPWMPPPQMILVLGGDVEREKQAAALARQSNLPVLITGGSNPEYAQWVFEGQGVDAQKLQLDYAARDTLSNFTTLVDRLRRRGIRHLLLVTSSDHMDRALLVGRVVAGSRGIHLTPVPVPCGDDCRPERRSKVWGDGVRALVWVVSGRDLKEEMQGAPAEALIACWHCAVVASKSARLRLGRRNWLPHANFHSHGPGPALLGAKGPMGVHQRHRQQRRSAAGREQGSPQLGVFHPARGFSCAIKEHAGGPALLQAA